MLTFNDSDMYLKLLRVGHIFQSLLSLFPKEKEKNIWSALSIHFVNPLLDLKGILGHTNISVKEKVMMDGGLSKHYFSVNMIPAPFPLHPPPLTRTHKKNLYISKSALKVGNNLLKAKFQI